MHKCAFCEKPVSEKFSLTIGGVTWKQTTCEGLHCKLRALEEFTQFWVGPPFLPEQDWETCCFFHVKKRGET